jgi:hypothetical protein
VTATIAAPAATTTRIAQDNAAYAWHNRAACPFRDISCFYSDHCRDLDPVAIAAMEQALIDTWAVTGLGHTVEWVPEGVMESPWSSRGGVADQWYWIAWDRAAQSLDAMALIEAAGLTEEYARYVTGCGHSTDSDRDF